MADVEKAGRFGIDPAAVSLADAHAGIGAFQTGLLARAKAYGEAVEQVRVLGDTVMANAGELVPAGSLADDIDERATSRPSGGKTPAREPAPGLLETQFVSPGGARAANDPVTTRRSP